MKDKGEKVLVKNQRRIESRFGRSGKLVDERQESQDTRKEIPFVSDMCPEPIGPATGYAIGGSSKDGSEREGPMEGSESPDHAIGGNYHLRTSYGSRVTGR